MKCNDEAINYIKEVKANFYNNLYSSGRELKEAFYKMNELTGTGTNGKKYENLIEILKVQEFLIMEVCKMHEMENDPFNTELFKKSKSIKVVGNCLKDGKRACNIYSFNDSDYDYFFIGDLHSDTTSLKKILQVCDFFDSMVYHKKMRLVFLGDYVDRGKAHIKMLEYILTLKYVFPDNIYLLKGNHDDGFLDEDGVRLAVRKNDNESDEDYFLLYLKNLIRSNGLPSTNTINAYLSFFNSLCNAAFVSLKNTTILAVHAGIPRPRKDKSNYYNYINSISDLTNDNIKDILNNTVKFNMFWSDPCEEEADLRESIRRFRFNIEHFNEFQNIIDFDFLVRGHEAEEEGYKSFFNGRLYTVFSSGSILENYANLNEETAYQKVSPKILQLEKVGQIKIVDLNL